MYEINWQRLSSESDYYMHGAFLFKRRRMPGGYYVYTVWNEGQLLFNTINSWAFYERMREMGEQIILTIS